MEKHARLLLQCSMSLIKYLKLYIIVVSLQYMLCYHPPTRNQFFARLLSFCASIPSDFLDLPLKKKWEPLGFLPWTSGSERECEDHLVTLPFGHAAPPGLEKLMKSENHLHRVKDTKLPIIDTLKMVAKLAESG